MKFLQRSILFFVIAISFILSAIEGSAQTRVCSGDSVVLVLNGYKQGVISWWQSSDRTAWSVAGDHDSLVIVATTTSYYRAKVTDGTCDPYYSDTILVIVNPTPPVALPATNITPTSFIAHWSSVPGATNYFLDVATDAAFTSFVTGKKNFEWSDTTLSIDGLTCHSPYYYRVRDTSGGCPKLSANSNTITANTDTCPPSANCGIITDARDGKTYKTVIIGTQCWMAQNLNVGMAIPGVVPQTNNPIIEKYCYNYGGTTTDSSLCNTYGGLYLWDEMMNYGASASGNKGPQGICPTAWHIPTDEEWSTLVSYIGSHLTAGVALALKSTSHLWTFYSDATKGTNSSGFSALPGGCRLEGGLFSSVGTDAYFGTATEGTSNTAWLRVLYHFDAQVYRDAFGKAMFGYSVRCVKG